MLVHIVAQAQTREAHAQMWTFVARPLGQDVHDAQRSRYQGRFAEAKLEPLGNPIGLWFAPDLSIKIINIGEVINIGQASAYLGAPNSGSASPRSQLCTFCFSYLDLTDCPPKEKKVIKCPFHWA